MGDIGTKEAARQLGISQQTVAKYCRRGLIPGATHDCDGSPWHIPKQTIEDLLKENNGGKIIWKK